VIFLIQKLIKDDGKENIRMHWEILIALIIATPVILFPAAYVWYLNIGGIFTSFKEAREKRLARKM